MGAPPIPISVFSPKDFLPSATGTIARPVSQKLTEIVSVTDFAGVDPSGNTDSTAGIRAADAAVTGIVLFPPGTYLVSPDPVTKRVFTPTRGNTWRGHSKETSIIKIKNGVGDFFGIICSSTNDLSGLTVEKLQFNMNATGNPVTSALALNTYPRSAIYVGSTGSPVGSHIDVHGCAFTDIDDFITISVQSGGSDIRIENNRFEISGGTVAHDHSTLNILASSVWIVKNRFVGNPVHNSALATAIETHGGSQYVVGNIVTDMMVGGNLTGIATGNRSIIWSGNHFLKVAQGIQLWSFHASWAGVPYTDIVIDATTNTIITSTSQPFTLDNVDNVMNVTGGTGFTGTVSVPQRVRILSVDATGKATCDVAVGTVGSTAGVGLLWDGLKDVQITDNEITIDHKGWVGKITTIAGINMVSADLPLRKLWIIDNKISFISIGAITTADSNDFGIFLTSFGGAVPITDLRIEDNSISSTVAGGIWLNMRGLVAAAKISRNHFYNIGQGVGILADTYLTAIFPTGPFVDTVIDDNTIIDDQATHTIRSAVEGRFFTSTTNVRVHGTSLRITDGTVLPPYFGNASVAVHQSHVVNTFSNPGGLSEAGSQIIETTTGIVRYQTIAPTGNTWTPGGPIGAATNVAPAADTPVTFALTATGNAPAFYSASCGNGVSGQASYFWKDNGTAQWQQYINTGVGQMYVRDVVNGRTQVTYTPGASASAALAQFGSRMIVDDRMTAKTYVGTIATPTYGATVTIDASSGSTQKLTVTNGTAFTVAAPTNPVSGERLSIQIVNSSGGAMGAVTWNAVFKQDTSFSAPANGKRRTAIFEYDGTNWVLVGAWSGDQ